LKEIPLSERVFLKTDDGLAIQNEYNFATMANTGAKIMNWIRTAVIVVCMSGLTLSAFGQSDLKAPLLMDMERLADTKARIEKGDPELKPAMDQLIADAEAALLEGPYTVTDKTKAAPSGDKHDYASQPRSRRIGPAKD